MVPFARRQRTLDERSYYRSSTIAHPTLSRPRPVNGIALAVTCAVILTAVAFALFVRRDRSSDAPLRGTPLVPPKTAADFMLTGARGVPVHLIDRSYPATFLFFGYTHCRDECPLALASLGRAYRSLRPVDRSRTRIVFVSVDPARDTPAVMQRYVATFDSHIAGLSGPREVLTRVWKAYDVRVDPASHEIAHGGSIYAVDATARVLLEYPPDAPVADLAADAAALAKR